jgi:hypothetical protein
LRRVPVGWIGLGFVAVALAVYLLSNPSRQNFYNHFVWQAEAWLDGRAAIRWPVESGPVRNGHFQDVLPLGDLALTERMGLPYRPGFALIPFPPLPALVLLPLVAVGGLATNAALVGAILGAINVGLCWRMLTRVTDRRDAAALGTTFYGFGTVAWYAAMLGSTWFLAHVVASTCLFLAITAALDAERRDRGRHPARGRQALAGLALGAAALARLTTIFGAPFFALVGGGGSFLRRAAFAGVGAAVALLVLAAYNIATTGHLFHPAYEYLREHEHRPLPELYHPTWAAEDPRYIPQNVRILLLWPPEQPLRDDPACQFDPPSGLALLWDRECALVRPDPVGMSILLTSPAYLLALPALLWGWRRRLVAGAGLAVVAIALADLAHFSQGWVQFGYRFSNDFAPFALVLVTLGIVMARGRRLTWALALALVVASVAVNAWGVHWGVTLGW